MLRIEEVRAIDRVKHMGYEWNELLKRSGSDNIFLTHDWILSWWKYFSINNRLFILNIWDENRLVGIAPLMIRRHAFFGLPVRSVAFIGTDTSDRMDFILTTSRRQCMRAILNYIMKNSFRWDFVDLQEMPEESGNFRILRECLIDLKILAISGPDSRCYYIPIDGSAKHFSDHLSDSFRRSLRKAKNRVNRIGADFLFRRFIKNVISPEYLLSEMERIEKASWKGRRRTGIFCRTEGRQFHNEIIKKYAEKGMVDISFLAINGRNIVYQYSFCYGQNIYAYNSAYDEAFARFYPGFVLMLHLLQDSVDYSVRYYDLLRGEETWKTMFTSDYRIHARVRIFNRKAYSRFIYILQSRVLPYLKSKRTIYDIWMRLKEASYVFKKRY